MQAIINNLADSKYHPFISKNLQQATDKITEMLSEEIRMSGLNPDVQCGLINPNMMLCFVDTEGLSETDQTLICNSVIRAGFDDLNGDCHKWPEKCEGDECERNTRDKVRH